MPKRKRKEESTNGCPPGWTVTEQKSGGKTYTHSVHGKVRSMAAVHRFSDSTITPLPKKKKSKSSAKKSSNKSSSSKATKSTKSTKTSKSTKRSKATPTFKRVKGSKKGSKQSPSVGAKGVQEGETYCVVHKSHNVTIKRLMLDDALSQGNTAGWSEARIKAFAKRKTPEGQNAFYYRFNPPGEQQKNGKWEDEEKILFLYVFSFTFSTCLCISVFC
jgi:PAB1-binding protein PBP1